MVATTRQLDAKVTTRRPRYDGLNRRVSKTVGSDTTHYYYNTNWQVLCEYLNDTYQLSYVWGLDYIDSPIQREESGGTILQYLFDANRHVTSLHDATSGGIVERYQYDPYGKVTVLHGAVDADGAVTEWAVDNGGSDFGNEVLFTGMRYDPETGLYHARFRMQDSATGRWLQRDPIGYADGYNLYSSKHSLLGTTDPYGLAGNQRCLWSTIENLVKPFGGMTGCMKDDTCKEQLDELTNFYFGNDCKYFRGAVAAVIAAGKALEDLTEAANFDFPVKPIFDTSGRCCCDGQEQKISKNGIRILLGIEVGVSAAIEMSISNKGDTCPKEGSYFLVAMGPEAKAGVANLGMKGYLLVEPDGKTKGGFEGSAGAKLLGIIGPKFGGKIQSDGNVEFVGEIAAGISAGGNVGTINYWEIQLSPTGNSCGSTDTQSHNTGVDVGGTVAVRAISVAAGLGGKNGAAAGRGYLRTLE